VVRSAPPRFPERLSATFVGMCVMCAMAAATGATGARTWLQNSHATWLSPRRMRVATIGVMSAALAVSTVGLSGSTVSPHKSPHHPTTATARPIAQHTR
jgi:hypothetical protein